MYADVVVTRPTHRRPPVGGGPLRDNMSRLVTYTYLVPERLRELAAVGHLVQVPLGASAALGVIVGLLDEAPSDLPQESIRELAEILDPLPVVTPNQVKLTHWLADEYLAPLNQAIRVMLPPGLEERTTIVVSQTPEQTRREGLTAEEAAVLTLLKSHGGRMQLSRLLGRLGGESTEEAVHSLAKKGLIDARYALVPPKPAPPRIQYVRLLADDGAIEAAIPRLGHASKQADILLILARRVEAPLTQAELCDLVQCTASAVQTLLKRGWVEVTERRRLVVAMPGAEAADLLQAPKQAAALDTLLQNDGLLESGDLLKQAGVSTAVLSALEKKGLVQRITEEPVVLLKLPPSEVMTRVVELRGGEKQLAVLEALRGTTGRVWVGGIYAQTDADLRTLRQLSELGLISLHTEEYDLARPVAPETPPRLTREQQAVWQEVERGLRNGDQEKAPSRALLHGVTGSGKTEIYLRALEDTLAAGRRAIVLVPEISLTAQTVRRFEARFPGRVAVQHSQLSLGQRYAVWDRIRRGQADVVIGPRSALFTPISRVGLIVLDESHDDSYKQSEPIPLPTYHARDAALALGRLHKAPVLLGSATPDVVTYFQARGGAYQILELPHRVGPDESGRRQVTEREIHLAKPPLPPVRLVDLRQELRAGNRSLFSRALQQALQETLAGGEQAILFLNRRGAATFVLCRDCGYVAHCPNCDVPFTLHRLGTTGAPGFDERTLVCHHCNRREPAPGQCPKCGGPHIRHFGLGTERVEETVRQLHPGARLVRWDSDTASGPDHERFLQTFVEHRADVLIGTQMIAKGLDLPLVTLVGVVSADTALHLPDYRAAERTFQMLTHVAGRAGRSQRGGQVIVQTYSPDHYAIRAAAWHDYRGFYDREIGYRRQLGYPPFSRLVVLRTSDVDPGRCRMEAERMGRWLEIEIHKRRLAADMIGPVPCFYSRIRGRYRWQIVIRGTDPTSLLRDVALPWGWQVDVDPVSLL